MNGGDGLEIHKLSTLPTDAALAQYISITSHRHLCMSERHDSTALRSVPLLGLCRNGVSLDTLAHSHAAAKSATTLGEQESDRCLPADLLSHMPARGKTCAFAHGFRWNACGLNWHSRCQHPAAAPRTLWHSQRY